MGYKLEKCRTGLKTLPNGLQWKEKKKSQVTQESTVPNLMFLFEVGNIKSFQKLVFGG